MSKSIAGIQRFVGLDLHAETTAVAVAEKDGEVRSLGTIPNRPESVRKLLPKLGPKGSWWHTVISMPVRSASCCSSHFHRRTRGPLLPPASAVISSRLPLGYTGCPIFRHHLRMVRAAKVSVS